jgi:tRNA 2-thiocytidine biosynthesis protein TtcA
LSYIIDKTIKKVKSAIRDFHLIDNTQGIMVGLSGGKDSITLLYLLDQFKRISKYKYPLAAGHIGMGWDIDITPLKRICQEWDIPFYYEPTDIGPIIFQVRNEKNPCSLCAKMRRGALNNLAKKNGFPKVALAHHMDDAVETVLLKMFFEGRMESFNPKTYLDQKDITVIRPLVYVAEQDISRLCRLLQLPVLENPCPANGYTKRQDMKEIVKQIEKTNPLAKERVITALKNLDQSKSWKTME